ncbi:hypothetical protein B7P43_G10178 [Cryptotermes secundus]|uniref:Uncharacterized protein n=1 Tax=Cryptotermes secundus TaxID=105785 RepID=A0A2J7QER4_9NEOP|nr:hypothetical protein B7P43_G10178 [Cryptotermes secundus]
MPPPFSALKSKPSKEPTRRREMIKFFIAASCLDYSSTLKMKKAHILVNIRRTHCLDLKGQRVSCTSITLPAACLNTSLSNPEPSVIYQTTQRYNQETARFIATTVKA